MDSFGNYVITGGLGKDLLKGNGGNVGSGYRIHKLQR